MGYLGERDESNGNFVLFIPGGTSMRGNMGR